MDYSEPVEALTLKVLDSEGIFQDLNKWENYKLNWMANDEALVSPVPLGWFSSLFLHWLGAVEAGGEWLSQ